MPSQPTWFSRLDSIIAELNSLPLPWVDRSTLQHLLNVGPRRAQQILQPCVAHHLGANGLADRSHLIEYLRRLAAGESAHYEKVRRQKFLHALAAWRQDWISQPKLQIEAPHSVLDQQFRDLPAGVHLEPGRITLHFQTPHQALEKLLALSMAIANDFEGFEKLTNPIIETS